MAFTPIIATCDAALDREAEIYIKQLGVHLFKKWKYQYSNTVNWLRARLQMFILRSVSVCLSSFRTKWRGAGASDRVDMITLISVFDIVILVIIQSCFRLIAYLFFFFFFAELKPFV